MTFRQCDVKRNRICGSHPNENRHGGIEKKFNRTSNIFKLIPDQCQTGLTQMINTTVESQYIIEYSQAVTTKSQLSTIEETFYDEPAFDISLEVIKKSLRQADNASLTFNHRRLNYTIYFIIFYAIL